MKNSSYKPRLYLLLVLSVILLYFLINFIAKMYNFSSPISEETSRRFQSNLDHVKNNFSSLEGKKIGFVFKKVNDGSAEAKKYPLIRYEIIIDIDELKNISDFELRGLFSHELAHLESYSKLNWLQLGTFAIFYSISDGFKKKVERATDIRTIEKGFGKELLAFREYRLRTASENDKKILMTYYLSPDEIKSFAGIN